MIRWLRDFLSVDCAAAGCSGDPELYAVDGVPVPLCSHHRVEIAIATQERGESSD